MEFRAEEEAEVEGGDLRVKGETGATKLTGFSLVSGLETVRVEDKLDEENKEGQL